jgi:ketopantoate hydroxymethyltransferase
MKTKAAPMPKFNYPQGVEVVAKTLCPVIGNIGVGPMPADKTSGVKIRGTGAATKGTMARGPMA